MYEPTFRLLFEQAMRLDITSHLSSERVQEVIDEVSRAGSAEGSYRTTIRNGVAVIRANGSLMKQASSFSAGTSTVLLRQSLMAAMRDDSVNSALLAIESPGGTAAGTYELAETISRFASQKPIVAHIEDLGASAAYWIASATQSISANAPAKVGSIGTYAVIQDLSAMAAKEGVKVHVVRAGSEHKGAGVPGTEITPAQLAEFQRHVDRTNDFFVAGVAAGRKMTEVQVRQLADGRVHGAEEARQLGLIDHERAALGVVAEPTRDRVLWAVAGLGAWLRDAHGERQLRVRDDAEPETATVVNSRSHPDARIERVVERLRVANTYAHGSVGCKLAHIAEGRADMYFNVSGKCSMWDTCGPEVIIREAGGDLVGFDGAPIRYAGHSTDVPQPFIATTNVWKARVLEVTGSMADELDPSRHP
jgi:signal peptide peptidase SppA